MSKQKYYVVWKGNNPSDFLKDEILDGISPQIPRRNKYLKTRKKRSS